MISLRTFMKHEQGSYSCVKPSPQTMNRLTAYVQENLPTEQQTQAHDFHCTTMYSKKPAPRIENYKPELPIKATFKKFSLFGENSDVLVIEIESDELNEIFEDSVALGAEFTWPKYSPHITIAENVTTEDILDTLPAIDFEFEFEQYVVEGLDDD